MGSKATVALLFSSPFTLSWDKNIFATMPLLYIAKLLLRFKIKRPSWIKALHWSDTFLWHTCLLKLSWAPYLRTCQVVKWELFFAGNLSLEAKTNRQLPHSLYAQVNVNINTNRQVLRLYCKLCYKSQVRTEKLVIQIYFQT